jgi:hypothetical protein
LLPFRSKLGNHQAIIEIALINTRKRSYPASSSQSQVAARIQVALKTVFSLSGTIRLPVMAEKKETGQQ